MTTGREAFLQRVRQAVHEGNRSGHAPPLPVRGTIGYQGAAPDPIHRFCEMFTSAGGQVYRVPDREAALTIILESVETRAARHVLIGRGTTIDSLNLPERLRERGIDALQADALPQQDREPLFAADLSITGVDYLIAETGSLALLSRPDNPRSLSLLPPVHVVVATAEQIIPDLFDLFGEAVWGASPALPSCLSLITGPSKTGDIELRLVTGVHGPGEVHVILVSI
jgi:L-lactate utilization protein LutC